MDYRDALIEVLADIEAAKVPDDLRETAFAMGLDLKLGLVKARPTLPAGATVMETQPPSADGQPKLLASGTGGAAAALASRLGVSVEDIGEVFDFDGSDPDLIVGTGKLSSGAAAATKEIAVLIAAARQATGEEWTPFAEIRAVADQYGKLDSANFASTMKELEDYFSFRSPSPRKREVKLNRPGWERASALVATLVAR